MKKLMDLFKRETVFCVSVLLALASALAVRPDAAYLNYPDYRTLALLFCLMIIVAGFQQLGVFSRLGRSLSRRAGSLRRLALLLIFLCFFASMIITNDVTLLTFVPFTILVYRMTGNERSTRKTVVLETIAANLGSMATPIGNPQNLYLCSASGIDMGQFALAVLPYAGLSAVLLAAAVWTGKGGEISVKIAAEQPETGQPETGGSESSKGRENGGMSGPKGQLENNGRTGQKGALLTYLILLALCLLVVFRVLPYGPVLACVAVAILLVNRRLYRSVNYFLLLTFLCFFVFIGNMKRIPEVSSLLVSVVEGRELWAGILASQVISNVPAAILLSGFTEKYSVLLTAVNLGGLGTLVASLASLISFQLFAGAYPQEKGAFLKTFTGWNLLFLAILVGEALLLGQV